MTENPDFRDPSGRCVDTNPHRAPGGPLSTASAPDTDTHAEPPRGFHWHGARLRVNTIAFLPEDAHFIAEEALRRDCAAADVIRLAIRQMRGDFEKERTGG